MSAKEIVLEKISYEELQYKYIDESTKNYVLEKQNEQLQQENKQIKDNWDKLKEYLENYWKETQDIWFIKLINKMQELEKGDK